MTRMNNEGRYRLRSLALAAIGLFGTMQAFAVDSYTIIDLGTLGAGVDGYGEARGINNLGQVVGEAETSTMHVEHAFLYSGGVMIDLGVLDGTEESWANDVNDYGEVVGGSSTGFGPDRAFLYSGGVMVDLGTLGGAEALADDINNHGQVAGYSITATGEAHAFLYSGGVMTDMGTLGGVFSKAYGLNDDSQVVGDSGTASGDVHAFLYSGGVMADLGTLGGAKSWANDINDHGQVVGASTTAGGEAHAFLYSAGVMIDLGAMVGMSWAAAINNSGQIVGYDALHNASLYSDGSLVALGDLLPTGSEWSFLSVRDINDLGQIVGYGFPAGGGRVHGFLMSPVPVPAAFWLLGSGAAAVLASARRCRRE